MLAGRVCLVAGTVLLAATVLGETLVPSQEFGWFSYGPADQIHEELRRMARAWLPLLAGKGILMLLAYLCFLGAVAFLAPRSRGVAAWLSAAAAVAVPVLLLAFNGWPDPFPVAAEPAVWIAALAMVAVVAVAVAASQRAGRAWLAMAGAMILSLPAVDHLSTTVSNAELAADAGPPEDAFLSPGVAVAVASATGFDIASILPYATTAAGVLLIVLGCLATGESSETASGLDDAA